MPIFFLCPTESAKWPTGMRKIPILVLANSESHARDLATKSLHGSNGNFFMSNHNTRFHTPGFFSPPYEGMWLSHDHVVCREVQNLDLGSYEPSQKTPIIIVPLIESQSLKLTKYPYDVVC